LFRVKPVISSAIVSFGSKSIGAYPNLQTNDKENVLFVAFFFQKSQKAVRALVFLAAFRENDYMLKSISSPLRFSPACHRAYPAYRRVLRKAERQVSLF